MGANISEMKIVKMYKLLEDIKSINDIKEKEIALKVFEAYIETVNDLMLENNYSDILKGATIFEGDYIELKKGIEEIRENTKLPTYKELAQQKFTKAFHKGDPSIITRNCLMYTFGDHAGLENCHSMDCEVCWNRQAEKGDL